MGKRGGAKRPRACGVLLVDKPLGVTSHDVVGWARRALGERAIGHCGTLDPGASGLLVLCVGPATRLVEHLSAADKRYKARFVLGEATDSADADGSVIATQAPDNSVAAQLPAALEDLVGSHELPPPAFSAVRVDGVRAHELARRGEAVELANRPMRVLAVTQVEVLDSPNPERIVVSAELHVSKGSYIRSLAVELGRRLGLPCRLDGLERTGAGRLRLDNPATVRGLKILEQIPAVAPDPTKKGRAGRGQKPRTRLGLGAEGPESVASNLLDVPDVVDMPCVTLDADHEVSSAALARLEMGQRLSPDSPQGRAMLPAGVEMAEDQTWLVRGLAKDSSGEHTLAVLARKAGRGGRGPSIQPVKLVKMWPAGAVAEL